MFENVAKDVNKTVTTNLDQKTINRMAVITYVGIGLMMVGSYTVVKTFSKLVRKPFVKH